MTSAEFVYVPTHGRQSWCGRSVRQHIRSVKVSYSVKTGMPSISHKGRQLLTHELAHVSQDATGRGEGQPSRLEAEPPSLWGHALLPGSLRQMHVGGQVLHRKLLPGPDPDIEFMLILALDPVTLAEAREARGKTDTQMAEIQAKFKQAEAEKAAKAAAAAKAPKGVAPKLPTPVEVEAERTKRGEKSSIASVAVATWDAMDAATKSDWTKRAAKAVDAVVALASRSFSS